MSEQSMDDSTDEPMDEPMGEVLERRLQQLFRGMDRVILFQVRSILDEVRELMPCAECGLLVPAEDESRLQFLASANSEPGTADIVEQLQIPVETSLAGYVFNSCQPICVSNPDDYYAGVDEKTGLVTRFYLATPIIDGDVVVGVLTCVNRPQESESKPFDATEIQQAGEAAAVLANAIRFYRRFHFNLELIGGKPANDHGQLNPSYETQLESAALSRAINSLERLSPSSQDLAADLIQVLLDRDQGHGGMGYELQ